MVSTTQTFIGSGLKLCGDVHGDPTNPAVIFLHGGGQTRHAWGHAAKRFADEGFFAVTLDLRGHGDSGWAQQGDYDIQRFIEDLLAVLEQLPAHPVRPALVGASLGGVAALLAVGTTPRPIARALVLVDIVPRVNPEGAQRIHDFMSANPDGFATLDEAADAVASYLPHRPRPKDVSGLKKNLRLRNGRYYWHWDPGFISHAQDFEPLLWQEQLENAARNVHIPTLLVKGSLSEIVDAQSVEEFHQVLPNGEVVEVEGAGHMVAGDKNNAFEGAVLDFLLRHPS